MTKLFQPRPEDPLLAHSRREAVAVVLLWATAALWTLGYCSYYGYQANAEPILLLGVPSWVVWGVFLPWTACTCASTFLASVYIRDADLGKDPEEPEVSEMCAGEKLRIRNAARERDHA